MLTLYLKLFVFHHLKLYSMIPIQFPYQYVDQQKLIQIANLNHIFKIITFKYIITNKCRVTYSI